MWHCCYGFTCELCCTQDTENTHQKMDEWWYKEKEKYVHNVHLMSNNSFSLKFTDKSSHQKARSHLFRPGTTSPEWSDHKWSQLQVHVWTQPRHTEDALEIIRKWSGQLVTHSFTSVLTHSVSWPQWWTTYSADVLLHKQSFASFIQEKTHNFEWSTVKANTPHVLSVHQ